MKSVAAATCAGADLQHQLLPAQTKHYRKSRQVELYYILSMQKIAFTRLQISLAVITFVLLLSSCASDKSLSDGSYYQTRVVKPRTSRGLAMPAFRNRHINYADRTKTRPPDTTMAETRPVTPNYPSGITKVQPLPAADIAATDNNLYVNPARERLKQKISNLYRTEKDIKSFRRQYKEIKRQEAERISRSGKTDEPKKDAPKRKVNGGLSSASLVFALMGLFVAGIICGVLAIVCGLIGMNKGMQGVAIAGIILGVVDILGVLIVLGAL